MAPISKGTPRRILKARKQRAERKIVQAVRAQLVDRAERRCERCRVWCGETGHAHHRKPRSLGGEWTLDNLQLLCATCHWTAHAEHEL